MPTTDNYYSDGSDSDDSSKFCDPMENHKLDLQRLEQQLTTTQQVVKDLVECVISPSDSFLTKIFREKNKEVRKHDQEKVLQMLKVKAPEKM